MATLDLEVIKKLLTEMENGGVNDKHLRVYSDGSWEICDDYSNTVFAPRSHNWEEELIQWANE